MAHDTAGQAHGERGTILVIDDTPANIEILADALESQFNVIFATDGPEGLELALQERPDLVLLDLMMPGMDGYEVCRRLKEDDRTRGIPVIFVTAVGEEEEEARGLELGAIDYIVKPFSLPILKARTRAHYELKRYKDLLENMAYVDGLTGIPNRRQFEEFLKREWARSSRSGGLMTIGLIDVDHFKKFNDNYGHAAGDDCLRQVAQALKAAAMRPGDLIARYGGEEFVCVLPDTDGAGAAQAAERLRQAVDALNLAHAYSGAADHVTISLGFATGRPRDLDSPKPLLEQADALLYRAKEAGRNRVATASV